MPTIRLAILLLLTTIYSGSLIAQTAELSAREKIIKDFYEGKIEVIQNKNMAMGIVKDGEILALEDSLDIYRAEIGTQKSQYQNLNFMYLKSQSKGTARLIFIVVLGVILGGIVYLKWKEVL